MNKQHIHTLRSYIRQSGSTFWGLLLGVVCGVIVAAFVAVYINKLAIPLADDTKDDGVGKIGAKVQNPLNNQVHAELRLVSSETRDGNGLVENNVTQRPSTEQANADETSAFAGVATPATNPTQARVLFSTGHTTATPRVQPSPAPNINPLELQKDLMIAAQLNRRSPKKIVLTANEAAVYMVETMPTMSYDLAEEIRARGILSGINGEITQRIYDNGTNFVIRFGPFDRKINAAKIKAQLAQLGITGQLVVKPL